ncbi:conserved hypothetical protein [Desulfamplus magnetovallimortis]|uniref:Toxin n=1 Tax=Desulfamplus magnetovallimortis TaxID=1246637 RepID=A0A1W1HI73_9BACT|nr:hypothetical protein [Desulfamplus magnetovallimortis]SLM32174.1 conserved hypothetical protein [Desulfamplus magnetovallimortis]
MGIDAGAFVFDINIKHMLCLIINYELYYKLNYDKNKKLKIDRNLCFEQVVMHIERGDLLDVVSHPKQSKYPNQQILVVEMNDYVYLVPFIEDNNGKFLKTIIPSRKATRDYLGGRNNDQEFKT